MVLFLHATCPQFLCASPQVFFMSVSDYGEKFFFFLLTFYNYYNKNFLKNQV